MFRFYSNPTCKNRVTVVGTHSEGVLKIAVARCSKKDSFIKKKGRMIAEGRLAANKLHSLHQLDTCEVVDFVNIAKTISDEVTNNKIVYNSDVKVLDLTEEELRDKNNFVH